jgi:hypothetical protein
MPTPETSPDAPARAVYAVIREIQNPFGKTWDELTEAEREEPRRLAKAALEAANNGR